MHDMHDTPYGTSSMRVSQMQMKGEGVFERRTTPVFLLPVVGTLLFFVQLAVRRM